MSLRIQLVAILLAISVSTLWGQQGRIEFGKNRVQYHRNFDEWSRYESDNFIVYWYGVGRNVGQAVVQLAEYDFTYVQRVLEHRLNDKVQIIVYTDLTDLKQSNIGSDETFVNTGEAVKVEGKKIFVYFNGNHLHLRKQIREGIASIYLNAMLYGGNFQEVIQNAVLLNLPTWFKPGLVGYIGESWNAELDNRLKEIFALGKYKNFEKFAEDHPVLAGHSFWFFISEIFGDASVSNLLYLTRINRSMANGFVYVLGTPFGSIADSWFQFFSERFRLESSQLSSPDDKDLIKYRNKRNIPVTQLKVSPDGRKVAYVLNDMSKYRIIIRDLASGSTKVIVKQGSRNVFQETDYTYPLINWEPGGQGLGIIFEKRDIIYLGRYDVTTRKFKKEEIAPPIERIHSFDYISANTIVFSATVAGFTDLFQYMINSRQSQRLTNDFYDDLDVAFVRIQDKRGILFSSNRGDAGFQPARMDTILPIGNFDIYYFPLDDRGQGPLRVTNTPFANERKPVAIDGQYFGYLSDESGIFNVKTAYLEDYIAYNNKIYYLNSGYEIVLHEDSIFLSLDSSTVDSIITAPVIKQRAVSSSLTSYDRNIQNWDVSGRTGIQMGTILRNGKQVMFRKPLDMTTQAFVPYTLYMQNILKRQRPDLLISPEKLKEKEEVKDERPPILFQSEFGEPAEEKRVVREPFAIREMGISRRSVIRANEKVYPFRPGRITTQRMMFRNDFITSKMDNELLFEGMESFAANPDGFGFQQMGLLSKANFKDMFEDYEFEVGARIPTNFNGGEFYGIFRDKKRRLDKTYAVYRKVNKFDLDTPANYYQKLEKDVLLGQFGVRYPMDIFRSFRLTATVRRDRETYLATAADPQRNFYPFNEPTRSEERVGLKGEYVFDNTRDISLNIKNGTRYKLFGEMVKRFDINTSDGFKIDFRDGFMTILGMDARHYEPFLKKSIMAFRLAGATSFGSERMLYYLGGTENWLFPSRNEEIPSPTYLNYAYQTLAANMRGFQNNIRNGSSYVLANAEVRMPVFSYLFGNVRSGFIRNFQVVGFFDMGTAWEGTNPYNPDNPLNSVTYPDPKTSPNAPISIQVNYFRDPVVVGYGFGVRTTLLGYFLRADYGWGIETKVVQKPRLFISMGLDF
jgi:hypothetical protein